MRGGNPHAAKTSGSFGFQGQQNGESDVEREKLTATRGGLGVAPFRPAKPILHRKCGSIRQQYNIRCWKQQQQAGARMEPGPAAGPRRATGGRRERNVSTTPRLRKSVRRDERGNVRLDDAAVSESTTSN